MTKKRRFPLAFAAAAFGLLLVTAASTTVYAGQTTDELLAKKYEKILGKYEIEQDGQTALLEFAVRRGGLWADSGDGRPAEMIPVNDSLEEFTAEDADNGKFEFKFQKDEAGVYTSCHIVNQVLGMDVVAVKIK